VSAPVAAPRATLLASLACAASILFAASLATAAVAQHADAHPADAHPDAVEEVTISGERAGPGLLEDP
jgi:hypothetical protein